MFAELAGDAPYQSNSDVPFNVLMPAFLTSELKTAFQIGFLLFLPFLVIDMVIASVLMSLGMMMLSLRMRTGTITRTSLRTLGIISGQMMTL